MRDFEAATRRMAHRAASEAVAAAQRAARDSRAVDRHHTAMDVERDAQIAQSFLESLQSAVPVRANDDRQQGSRQQQGHPEGNERRNHRSGPSTGRDILRQGILDEEDRVRRCIECGWEIDGKECARWCVEILSKSTSSVSEMLMATRVSGTRAHACSLAYL